MYSHEHIPGGVVDGSSFSSLSSEESFYVFSDNMSVSVAPTPKDERQQLQSERQALEEERQKLAAERQRLEEARKQLMQAEDNPRQEKNELSPPSPPPTTSSTPALDKRTTAEVVSKFHSSMTGLSDDSSSSDGDDNDDDGAKARKDGSPPQLRGRGDLVPDSVRRSVTDRSVSSGIDNDSLSATNHSVATNATGATQQSALEKARAQLQEQRKLRQTMIRERIAKEEAEAKRKKKEEEAKKREEVKAAANTEKARCQRAYGWYNKLAMPNREQMRKKVSMLTCIDISLEDVDLLPWTASGSMVNVAKLNKILFSG